MLSFSFQFKACLTIDTSNSLQKSIIKLLKQAQKKVLAAKDVVNAKMNEAKDAVLRAQEKVASWREGNGPYFLCQTLKTLSKRHTYFQLYCMEKYSPLIFFYAMNR